jgi:hypothetical protein
VQHKEVIDMARVGLSKSKRFNVFKRDSFTCQYCGATPPRVVLEVDHINPIAKGGKNSIDNLITACFDCNRGKSAGLLTSIPESVVDRASVLAEKMEQVKAYERLVKAKKKHEESQINEVEEAFCVHFSGFHFSPKFRESVRLFLRHFATYEVVGFMHKACSKIPRREDSVKYFCGICWKQIKDGKNG